MKVKVQSIAIIICLISSVFCCFSCKEKYRDILISRNYEFEVSDTLLTPNVHEFELTCYYMRYGNEDRKECRDWEFLKVSEWVKVSDNDTFGVEKDVAPNGFDYGWIKAEKIAGSGKMRIIIDENTQELKRGVKILFGFKPDDYKLFFGEIIIRQSAKEDNSPVEVKVRYQGKLYSSMATFDSENKYVFENQEMTALVAKLQNKNVETIVTEDGVVNVYDNDDAKAKAAIESLMGRVDASKQISVRDDIAMSRAEDPFRYIQANALGYAALFDDNDYTDTDFSDNLFNLNDFYDQDYMYNLGLNDKVTSLAVAYNGTDPEVCSVLTIWEDSYYNHGDNDRTKHRISFVASYNNPRTTCRDLKAIPCINSGDSWNDRISSISLHFGNYGSYLRDY